MTNPIEYFMNPSPLRQTATLVVLLVVLNLSFSSRLNAQVKVGDTLPSISKFGLAGKLPTTKGKVVLVDVWATWCKPCREAFPVLEELQKKYGSQGFTVLAISVDEDPKAYHRFLTKQNPGVATALDQRHALAKVLAPRTMPTSYIIDRKGKIRYLHNGFKGRRTRAAYIKEIEFLLKE